MENNNQTIALIQKRRADGLTDEQIRATLINQGFNDEQINGLIEESYKAPVAPAAPQEAEKPKKKGWWPF